MNILYINRKTGQKEVERVYKNSALLFLYGEHWFTKLMSKGVLPLVAKLPFFSQFYGYLQKRSSSRKKIGPFIKHFDVNESEFLESIDQFHSFNDFFIRRLKFESRPIAAGSEVAVIPADGRYYFYQNINEVDGFIVKGKKFNFETLLENKAQAHLYEGGSMVLARLCPSDYHRFHFSCDGVPGASRVINGWLYSVNPIAIKKNLDIFTQNKRTVCEIETEAFGQMLYVEVGATCVGSIQETYRPGKKYLKGEEKGYFEFGGSSLILLFQKGTIGFDEDLLEATRNDFEIRCLMGESMGKAAS